jgi:hypothetical protein
MLDFISALALAGMFFLSLLYVSGCDRLKGTRS